MSKISCIRSRMFTTKGTARVGHASDLTMKKIGFSRPFGVSIRIQNRIFQQDILTTLEHCEVVELHQWLSNILKKDVKP